MTSDDDWHGVLDTNLGGVFRCCRAVLPGMISRRRGAIVNIASLAALHGLPGQAAYGASKAGIIGLTRSLAREVGKRRIRVNAVVPGAVLTPRIEASWADEGVPRPTDDLLESLAMPEDIAGAILFLVSDLSKKVTGQSVVVDGGWKTRFPYRME